MGLITHLVILKLLPSLSDAERHLLASKFLALQDQCELEGGGKYLTVTGGKQNSPEGMAKGFEQVFNVTFETAEARDYYNDKDPAHQEFKAYVADKVADILVFDFEQGVFWCAARLSIFARPC
ncbi:hypothetical protein JCM10213_002949 [Rhodosporidiobolus nylandii]